MTDYAIVLTVGAREAIREMEEGERDHLVDALRQELFEADGRVVHPHAVIRPTGSPLSYPARALSSGHVVVFRLMEEKELKELARQRHETLATAGVIVHDILSGSPVRGGSVTAEGDL